MNGNIQEPSQLPSPGFINTARILEESKYRRIEERNKKENYKTVQVFTRKEVHEEIEWKTNNKGKSINDAEEQSSQALTVKIESDSGKDHGAGAPHQIRLETIVERQEVTSQNTQYGTCDTIIKSNGNEEIKEEDSLLSEKKLCDALASIKESGNDKKEIDTDEDIFAMHSVIS